MATTPVHPTSQQSTVSALLSSSTAAVYALHWTSSSSEEILTMHCVTLDPVMTVTALQLAYGYQADREGLDTIGSS